MCTKFHIITKKCLQLKDFNIDFKIKIPQITSYLSLSVNSRRHIRLHRRGTSRTPPDKKGTHLRRNDPRGQYGRPLTPLWYLFYLPRDVDRIQTVLSVGETRSIWCVKDVFVPVVVSPQTKITGYFPHHRTKTGDVTDLGVLFNEYQPSLPGTQSVVYLGPRLNPLFL